MDNHEERPWTCDICGAVILDDKQEYCDCCGEKIDRTPRKNRHTGSKGILWILLAILGLIFLLIRK